jgi:hypothetical protein
MSHFCGLVILTPEYAEFNGMDDSLAKYDENLEAPEYRVSNLPDKDKWHFLEYYSIKKSEDRQLKDNYETFKLGFIKFMRGKKGYMTQKKCMEEYSHMMPNGSKDEWVDVLICINQDKFAEFFKQGYPELWDKFEETYAEFGDDWNSNNWRKDEDGVWAEYSEYNPDSKWDWYCVGGRWRNSILTKSGEFVDICKFGEMVLEPYPEDAYEDGEDWLGNPCKQLKEGFEWHYSKDDMPFCLVIDGVWYERGEMGWFACVSNEKDKNDWNNEVLNLLENIPADSEVYSVDFHI